MTHHSLVKMLIVTAPKKTLELTGFCSDEKGLKMRQPNLDYKK